MKISADYRLCLNAIFYDNPPLILAILELFPQQDLMIKGIGSFLRSRGFKDKNRQRYLLELDRFNGDQFKEKLNRLKINVMFRGDPHYPVLLNEIHDPPDLLYYKGDLTILRPPYFAVVGPRFMSEYGEQVCRFLLKRLCPHLTIVSGMALGIDATAHATALMMGHPTVAVLGSGLDIIYPKKNEDIYRQIEEKGVLFSEFPPGTEPEKYHFPQRNRIISGMCEGTLIIEANKKSGSLITARNAMEQNREVFAVPGSIFSEQAKGVHQLIQDGVKCVTCVEDIFEELPSCSHLLALSEDDCMISDAESNKKTIQKPQHVFDSLNEKKLYDALDIVPLTIDEIVNKSGLFVTEVLQYLTLFELNNIVCQHPGSQYSIKVIS